VTNALPIPERIDDMSPAWLTAALSAAGLLRPGRIAAVRWERVGQAYGFTGVVARGEVRYGNANDGLPPTLIAKLPMAMDGSVSAYRAAQEADPRAARRYYERSAREAHFYRLLQPDCAPRLYFGAVDDDQRRVLLLLEDVSDGLQGDVLRGCSIADVRLVIDALARFHAQWWDRRPPGSFERIGIDPRTWQARYTRTADRFLDFYGDRVPPVFGRLVTQLRPRLAPVAEAMQARRRTVIHGDLHLDNLIFDRRRRDRPVVLLDWQTAAVGVPAWDLALLVFDSLSVEERRAAEDELFDRYVTQLREHGVHSYTVEQLRRDCGLALLFWLAGTVGWLTTLDENALTEREQALRQAIFDEGRLAAALVDHDAETVLAETVQAIS
jgi:Ecdysteroid kinase-like family